MSVRVFATGAAAAGTHRVTPWIFGTSLGSRIAYDTPLNVVPTSSARTRLRVVPMYGLRVPDAGFMGDEILWRGIR